MFSLLCEFVTVVDDCFHCERQLLYLLSNFLHLTLLGSVNISRFDQGAEQKETCQTFYSYPEQLATCAGKGYGA